MSKLYVPNYNTNNCVVINSNESIRVYNEKPTQRDRVYSYTDYFYNLGYISKSDSVTFSQYQSLPSCFDSNQITTDYYYRLDFDKILVMFFILAIICIYFPFKIFSRAFGRWLKL